MQHSSKRLWLPAVIPLLALGIMLSGAWTPASAQQPITISILDNGGDYASTGVIIENYKKAFPNKVKEIKLQRGPAPETPAKIKAQQDAGRADINLILTGQDAGSVLAANQQLVKLFPTYDKMFPKDELKEEAKILQDEGGGFLIPTVVNAGGPVFVYNPKKVQKPPKTAVELLAWAKANPKRFLYARPANSG
ncbi:MAG TPA: extracellular solute-binding protein, partial [Candidatus Methylomirabilis sp.]|nr:extracellular solute-binding protein [Candidatus Methylomirabilis sp.]